MGVRRRRWRWAAALALCFAVADLPPMDRFLPPGRLQGKKSPKYTATFVGALDTVHHPHRLVRGGIAFSGGRGTGGEGAEPLVLPL